MILGQTSDSNGVYFVPAFGVIKRKNKDMKSAAGFIGIRPNTTKAHMLRAVIDSIVFDIKAKFELLIKDLHTLGIPLKSVRLVFSFKPKFIFYLLSIHFFSKGLRRRVTFELHMPIYSQHNQSASGTFKHRFLFVVTRRRFSSRHWCVNMDKKRRNKTISNQCENIPTR